MASSPAAPPPRVAPVVPPVAVETAPVAPPPAPAAPRVDEAGKAARESALAVQRQRQAMEAEKAAWQAEQASARAALEADKAAIEKAKKLGPMDLAGLYAAHGISREKMMEHLNQSLMALAQTGTIPETEDAPQAKLIARLDELEGRLAKQKEEDAAQRARQEEEDAERNQQTWYADLNRKIMASPDCRFTKSAFGAVMLDRKLQEYEQRTGLDSASVFGDLAKETELEIAGVLNEQKWYRIEDGKQYDASGAVVGYTSPTAPVAAAPVPAAALAPGQRPSVTPNPLERPQPAKPSASERLPSLDPQRDGGVPVPSQAMFGRKIHRVNSDMVARYDAMVAAKNGTAAVGAP